MLEFLNAIQVSLVNPDKHGNKNVYDFVADTFSYIPQLTDNNAGNYWNCDKTIVIDLPDAGCFQSSEVPLSQSRHQTGKPIV